VDLISTLLLKFFHLSVECRVRDSRLQVVPLADMIKATFDGSVLKGAIDKAINFLEQDSIPNQNDFVAALEPLATAAKERWVREHLERVGKVLDELLAMSGVVETTFVPAVQLRLTDPLIFRYLQCLYASPISSRPVTILVGAVTEKQPPLPISLRFDNYLDRLELAFVPNDPNPRIRTSLWLRLSANEGKKQLEDWTEIDGSKERKINVYDKPLPAAILGRMISVKPIRFPYSIFVSELGIRVDVDDGVLRGIRTSILDQYNRPLILVDRIIMAG